MRTLSRPRVAAVVAAAAALLPLPAADAHAPAAALVVTAGRTATVDVTLPVVELDYGFLSVRTTGRYAALYLEPRDAANQGYATGALWAPYQARSIDHVPVFALGAADGWGRSAAAPHATFRGWARKIPAGRYRIHVVTDGARATTIRLPATGLRRDAVLRATRAAADAVHVAHRAPSSPLDATVAVSTPATRRTVWAVAAYGEARPPAGLDQTLHRPRVCLRAPADTPDCVGEEPEPARVSNGWCYDERRATSPLPLSGWESYCAFAHKVYEPGALGTGHVQALGAFDRTIQWDSLAVALVAIRVG